MTNQEKAYNRMKKKFADLAGYYPSDKSDTGIRLKIMADEIGNIEDAMSKYKRIEIIPAKKRTPQEVWEESLRLGEEFDK